MIKLERLQNETPAPGPVAVTEWAAFDFSTQYLVASAIGLKTRDHGTIVNMWLGEQYDNLMSPRQDCAQSLQWEACRARYTSQACVFSRMYINTKNAVVTLISPKLRHGQSIQILIIEYPVPGRASKRSQASD